MSGETAKVQSGRRVISRHPSVKWGRPRVEDPTVVDAEESPSSTAEKASAQLLKLVGKVVDSGVGPMTGSVAWAEDRLARIQGERYEPIDGVRKPTPETEDDINKTISKLVTESIQAASVNGFVTGLGGFIAMPVTVPANMAGALIVNARLAGAIAYLRGYDPTDPHVRTVVTLVAVGSSTQQIAKTIGIKVGEKLAMQAIKQIPIAVIREINKKAGFMLLAKYGSKRAAVTLAKGIPLVGGVVGGAVDGTMTSVIGRTARSMFPVA